MEKVWRLCIDEANVRLTDEEVQRDYDEAHCFEEEKYDDYPDRKRKAVDKYKEYDEGLKTSKDNYPARGYLA